MTRPRILVAATVPPFASRSDPNLLATRWLLPHVEMAWDAHRALGADLDFFAAIETDGGGIGVHSELLDHLGLVQANVEAFGSTSGFWSFQIETGARKVNSRNRLGRICTGRNLIIERALEDRDVEWILHLDADLAPPEDALSRLLEVGEKVVGGWVDVYNFDTAGAETVPLVDPRAHLKGRHGDGPAFAAPLGKEARVLRRWNTAGFLLVHRSVFTRIRWGWDPRDYRNLVTDDPWTQDLIERATGERTAIRLDVRGHHEPLRPLEDRDLDRSIR